MPRRHTLTDASKVRLRARWRTLARLAQRADAGELRGDAFEMLGELAPIEDKGQAWALFALARLCFAYVKADPPLRETLAPALVALGAAADRVLDMSDPGLNALGGRADPPPRRPRADIDG